MANFDQRHLANAGEEKMAYNQQQPVWTNQPLPPGWEAKYDGGQRRYFFINHSSHATTWEDPRKTAWEQSMARQQQQNLAPAWGSGRSASPNRSPRLENIAMSHSPKNWQKHVEDKYGMTVQHIKPDDEDETSFSDQPSPAVVSRLMHEYQSAEKDIIEAVLSSVSNDESRAKQELRSLGYHASHSRPRDLSPRPSPSGNKHHKTAAAPIKPAAPAPPPGMSETQKTLLKMKLIKEFSNCSASVVEMGLDASQYDEAKARILLQSMMPSGRKTSRESSPSKTKPSSSPSKKTSTSHVTNSASNSTTESPAKPSVPVTVSSFADTVSVVSVDSTPSTSSRKNQISKKPATTRKKSRAPVKQQTGSKGHYTSEFKTEPVGANAGLAKGPNLDNILDSYVKVKGSNPANWQGSQGAKGRDHSLSKGPDMRLLCGTSQGRVMKIQSSSHNFSSALVTVL